MSLGEPPLHIKTPCLARHQLGVFYFQLKTGGTERRISLRTRCFHTANIIALQLNLNIESARAMSNPKITDFDFKNFEALRQYDNHAKRRHNQS